ncbi:MAG: DNA-3-methyladenine glycosylase I [Proteobacteria bacterium]|nr:DNA-3-methyladenine glycosylase I [Pseudomonadota bacterium]MBU1610843.1 DNA-3-methyladenine glycosylase I [Pseudomonadota bacterium]
MKNKPIPRCAWVPLAKEAYVAYHDTEWGVPQRDEHRLFEAIVLQGAQAGLAWETILNKRENYRAAFDGFDPARVAEYDEGNIAALLENPGIVRNRLKVRSAVKNARVFLDMQQEFGGFSPWLWAWVDDTPQQSGVTTLADIPASTPLSDAIAKELKKRGMNFVGTTIIYALLQACGLVNDHARDCFRYAELGGKCAGPGLGAKMEKNVNPALDTRPRTT